MGLTTPPEDRLRARTGFIFFTSMVSPLTLLSSVLEVLKPSRNVLAQNLAFCPFYPLRKSGFIQILPHLCSNNPDMSFSALLFSYLLHVSLPLYRHDSCASQRYLDPPKPFLLHNDPDPGRSSEKPLVLHVLRSLLN